MSVSQDFRNSGLYSVERDVEDESVERNDESDDLDFRYDFDDGSDVESIPPATKDEPEPQSELKQMSLAERCRHVIDALSDGRRCWDIDKHSPESKVFSESDKFLLNEEHPQTQFPTALHVLAWEYKKEQAKISQPIIMYLLQYRRNQCREWADKQHVKADSKEALLGVIGHLKGPPILALAAEAKNQSFIDFVAQTWPEGFQALLDARDTSGKNCIHLMLNAERELYVEFVEKAWPSTLAAKDKDGNTALHYIMNFKLLKAYRDKQDRKKRDQLLQIFDLLLERADTEMKKSGELNEKGLSPYQHYLSTMMRSTTQRANQVKGKVPAGLPMNRTSLEDDKEKPTRGGNIVPEVNKPMPQPELTKVKAPTGLRGPNATEVPKLAIGAEGFKLARRNTATITDTPRTTQTNATDTKQVKVEPHPKSKGKGSQTGTGNLSGKLKLHYLRNRTELEARKLICTKEKLDINLSLDAMRHQGESIDKIVHLVDSLDKAGGFDSILSLVRLPVISHIPAQQVEKRLKTYAANQAKTRSGSSLLNSTSTPSSGRYGLVTVFDRLYEAGVRRIIRLEVYDTELPCHTDDAIEDAFRLRQDNKLIVERWNWRKPDLNTDVIMEAAGPELQQLHLYWSGNTTILKAWASPGGIPSLVSQFRRLKSIIIHYTVGYEGTSRVLKAIQQFNKQVTGDFEVKFDDNPASSTAELDVHGEWLLTGTETPDEHLWVQRMEEFRSALISLHRLDVMPEVRRTKVAIIDDGVDYDKIKFYDLDGTGNVDGRRSKVTGMNYCNSGNNWYHSSGKHGTLMTNSVLRINPWADIWMFKVQSGRSVRGGRTIYASSAADAVRDCVGRGFDIILMSWAVRNMSKERTNTRSTENLGSEKMSFEERASAELYDALQKARDDGILMFCAASNEIDMLSKDMLPYVAAPDYIFRIGSADSMGQRDAATSSPRDVDYYCPGNHVADAWDQRSPGQVEYHDGSSVATALAVGLVSVILYCASMLAAQHESGSKEYQRFELVRKQLRNRSEMKKALDNIGRENEWHELKFLPVWNQFGDAAKKMKEGKEIGIEELARLVNILYPY
ncbi:hypothetical protein F5Y14DRAFT_461013 [Nemania sp. NC0429]|nr:hypothetical protein F5Y14DRAFT_461013 [Nemania sp. NC0429]